MKREFSAGGVVYKFQIPGSNSQTNSNIQNTNSKREVLFLVRRASGGKDYRGSLGWTLPKGWIDEGETPEQAAVREVKEEGGVEAKIVEKLQTIKIFFTDQNGEKVMKFITYYLMEWEGDVPEGCGWETAEVKWVTKEEAEKTLAFVSEKRLVVKSLELIQSRNEKN